MRDAWSHFAPCLPFTPPSLAYGFSGAHQHTKHSCRALCSWSLKIAPGQYEEGGAPKTGTRVIGGGCKPGYVQQECNRDRYTPGVRVDCRLVVGMDNNKRRTVFQMDGQTCPGLPPGHQTNASSTMLFQGYL